MVLGVNDRSDLTPVKQIVKPLWSLNLDWALDHLQQVITEQSNEQVPLRLDRRASLQNFLRQKSA